MRGVDVGNSRDYSELFLMFPYLEGGTWSSSLNGDHVSGRHHLPVKVPEVNLDITRV